MGAPQSAPAPLIAWKTDDGHLAVPVDLTLFSVQAVLKTVYKLSDRAYGFLQRDPCQSDRLWVYLFRRQGGANLNTMALEFASELNDQQLRLQLEAQFREVRTLIVAQAFSEGNLLSPDDENVDYRTDPHGAGKHR